MFLFTWKPPHQWSLEEFLSCSLNRRRLKSKKTQEVITSHLGMKDRIFFMKPRPVTVYVFNPELLLCTPSRVLLYFRIQRRQFLWWPSCTSTVSLQQCFEFLWRGVQLSQLIFHHKMHQWFKKRVCLIPVQIRYCYLSDTMAFIQQIH